MSALHDSDATPSARSSKAPGRASLVLVTLILVAAVANLNLSVANVALPSIGQAFDSSQVTLNLIAVGYSLGLDGPSERVVPYPNHGDHMHVRFPLPSD